MDTNIVLLFTLCVFVSSVRTECANPLDICCKHFDCLAQNKEKSVCDFEYDITDIECVPPANRSLCDNKVSFEKLQFYFQNVFRTPEQREHP